MLDSDNYAVNKFEKNFFSQRKRQRDFIYCQFSGVGKNFFYCKFSNIFDIIGVVIVMIAIIKVESADFINRLDTEKFNLRMIPSTRIKFDSEDVKFYEPIFYNDVEVIDEPPEPDTDTYISKSQLPEYFWDYIQECISTGNFPTEEQLDPNNYYLKSSLPTFLNKFVAMALTKPANISAANYTDTCRLLNAEPKLLKNNQIYAAPRSINSLYAKLPTKTLSIASRYSSVSGGAPVSIAADGYYMPNQCGLNISDFLYQNTYDINKIFIKTKFESSSRTMLLDFPPSSNATDTLKGMYIEKTASNVIHLFIRNAASSNSSINVTLDTADINISQPVKITYIRNSTTKAEFSCDYTSTNGGYKTKETIIAINESMYPKSASARIGYRLYKAAAGTTIYTASISGAKTIQELSIDSINFKQYVTFDTSKIIENKLLTIV